MILRLKKTTNNIKLQKNSLKNMTKFIEHLKKLTF